MIRTICSSFLFLIPIYIAHVKNDTPHLIIFNIAMGLSIANHSHTFTRIFERRKLFRAIDTVYMYSLSGYLLSSSVYNNILDAKIALFLALMNYSIYRQLGDGYIESYTDLQKNIHVLFHTTGILSFTVARYGVPIIQNFA